jgi:YVTN family beta-propeller protein
MSCGFSDIAPLTGPAGQGTRVKVDPVRHIANEGSVTVIDLATGSTLADVIVHLHASALAVSPNRRYIVCVNAASDNLSVIDSRTDKVIETIWVKQSPADAFGASPNALYIEYLPYFVDGMFEQAPVIDRGMIRPLDVPGHGIRFHPDLLALSFAP